MKNSFDYKDLDVEGMETLDVISSADRFNRWMFDTIKPFCKGRILEIGSGIGNISQFFLQANETIFLSDIRDNYCDILRRKYSSSSSLLAVENLNLVDADFDHRYKHLIGTFDTVFALNVVEHIEDDSLAIANAKKLLANDGNLIILVPAYQMLYNRFDSELEHYRRYTKSSLNKLFIQNEMPIIVSKYFNLIGIFGWFVSGRLLKNKTIPQGQMSLYNLLVPIFKFADKVVGNSVGLSVVSVGKK